MIQVVDIWIFMTSLMWLWCAWKWIEREGWNAADVFLTAVGLFGLSLLFRG